MIKKEWKINETDKTKPLIERLLSVRGINSTTEEIKEFLYPEEITLLHPNAFCDMQKGVSRIESAIKNNEKILIYGDFDADGITSTSVLIRTLKHLNADVDYFIPSRETDGHGLNTNALVKLMVSVKPKLIITVDCGISNIEEVNFINSFNKDVIITDHHESGEILPNAYAIINPKAQNSLNEKLSAKEIKYLTSLAGVGVAFKLAQGVLERFDKLSFSQELLPYVALGTIADIVPLIGENRYYVKKGLELISKGYHYGIKRLLEISGYNNIEDGISAEQISFGVAPRINACGRLDTVKEAVSVMISDNKQEIELAAMALDNYNKIRQELCSRIFEEADAMAKNCRDNVIVLYKEDWHIGIIGIVASKIVEKYGKPAFLMSYSSDTNQIRCSARGVEGCEELNLFEIISNISEMLDGFGGHAYAAGLYFSKDKHSFPEVKKALVNSYNTFMNGKKITPVINIDLELEPEDITEDLIKEISRLEPFGASNPVPLFAVKDFVIKEKYLMGSNKEHLKIFVEKNGLKYSAIWWSFGDIGLNSGDKLDIAFYPQINTYNGNTTIQLIIKDIHSDSLIELEQSKVITYDNRKKTDILDKVNDYLKTAKFDFCVFAENQSVKDGLKSYPEIFKRIIDRTCLKHSDGIMFFDYPPSDEIMQNIMSQISPSRIHYMNYDISSAREFNYLKTIGGMLKYACNTQNGRFDIERSSCFLGITENLVEIMLEIYEDCGGIKIINREETYFDVSYVKPVSEEQFATSENYPLYESILKEIFDLREHYLNSDELISL